MNRADGRADDELRPISFTRGFQQHPAGSVLVEFGGTKVLCAASVTHRGAAVAQGFRARLADRRVRDAAVGHPRAQRPGVGQGPGRRPDPRDLPADRPLAAGLRRSARRWARTPSPSTATCCRPTAAPGRRRSPAPTSRWPTPSPTCAERGALADPQPLSCQIAAVSVGVVGGRVRLDLPYEEDARAEVDMNVVATDVGTLVEVQGTAEGATFSGPTLDAMIDSALAGIEPDRAAAAGPGRTAAARPRHRR